MSDQELTTKSPHFMDKEERTAVKVQTLFKLDNIDNALGEEGKQEVRRLDDLKVEYVFGGVYIGTPIGLVTSLIAYSDNLGMFLAGVSGTLAGFLVGGNLGSCAGAIARYRAKEKLREESPIMASHIDNYDVRCRMLRRISEAEWNL